MNYTTFIEESLKYASQIAKEKFGKVSGVTKPGDNNQVLTEADVAIGKYLIQQIEKEFPDYNIIDEEAGVIDKKSRFTWVVDPIDGTSNFAQALPLYGIMIGLLDEDKAVAGGIALPFFHEIYTAEKEQGAFCNHERIHASSKTNLLEALVAYTVDGHQEQPGLTRREAKIIGEIILGIRNLRATGSCYDVVMTARGKFGAYLNQSSKIWDNVAAQVILEESGCVYTDFYGGKISYKEPLIRVRENYTFCAAPKALHAKLQEIIHSVK